MAATLVGYLHPAGGGPPPSRQTRAKRRATVRTAMTEIGALPGWHVVAAAGKYTVTRHRVY